MPSDRFGSYLSLGIFFMRQQNGIHIRLDTDTMSRIDALTKGAPSNRSRLVREGVELRLNFETHATLLREIVETAAAEALTVLRQEAVILMRGQAEAAKASDVLNCQRMAAFIEALGEAPAAEPSKTKDKASTVGGVPRMPDREDV